MRFDRTVSVWTRVKRAALAFDAWMSASAFDSGEDFKAVWRRYTAFTDLFRARGAARVVLDLASEGVTLGLAGAFVMLGLAIPAFYETQEDWRRTEELAVTFLDRYGQEVGRRGIRQNDEFRSPVRKFRSGPSKAGGSLTRGPAFLLALGHRRRDSATTQRGGGRW